MREPTSRYWFPAKRYGWGWGLPSAWQGWVVIAVFAALAVAGIFLLPPERELKAFLLYVLAINAGLFLVCWLKGEPPRWRWGK
jgi:hypothetical protein